MQKQINELKMMIQPSASGQQSITGSHQQATISSASLSQNIPNPFSSTTTISYTLPLSYLSAKIVITDKKGSILKQINLPAGRQGRSGMGAGSVQLDTATVATGAYQYALYVDNVLTGTKQMVLAK